MIGDVNTVARLTTVLFATCYSFFNFTTANLSLFGGPGWRPRWKFYHWSLSILGSMANFVLIFMMHWPFALISILTLWVLVKYIEYEGSDRQWGGRFTGWLWTIAVRNVVALEGKDTASLMVRDWRPQIFVLLKNNSDFDAGKLPNTAGVEQIREFFKVELIRLSGHLKTQHGLVIICSMLLVQEICRRQQQEIKESVRGRLKQILLENDMQAFTDVICCLPDKMVENLASILETSGLGVLRYGIDCLKEISLIE